MPGVAGNQTSDPLITSPTPNQLSFFVPINVCLKVVDKLPVRYMRSCSTFKLMSDDTFRNLSSIWMRLCMSKEQSTVTFENNFYSKGHRLRFFFYRFMKRWTPHSPSWYPSLLTLSFQRYSKCLKYCSAMLKLLFSVIQELWGKIKEFKKQLFNPKFVSVRLAEFNFHQYLSSLSIHSSILLNLTPCNDILLWMFCVAHIRFNAIL